MPPKKPIARRKPPAAAPSDNAGATNTNTSEAPEVKMGEATDAPNSTATEPTASSSAAIPKPPRLDSLNRPTASSSSVRGKPGAPKPKFAGRRSQAARAEAEREQTEQKAKEAAERAKRNARRDGRGRGGAERGGRPGRGRGGYMGESDRPNSIASGPFSAGQAATGGGWGRRPAASGAGTFFGGSGGGGGGGQAGGSRTLRMGTTGIKHEGGEIDEFGKSSLLQGDGYISSDEDETDKGMERKDIDNLVVVDLTQDAEDPSQSFAPLRIPRQAHKERTIGLNADGAASADAVSKEVAKESGAGDKKKGKQRAKEVEIVGEKEKFHGTYSSSETEDDHIKKEPEENNDALANTEPVPADLEPPSSPESRRKAKDQIKARSSSDAKPQRPLLQTQEEIDEWNRQQRDLDILRSELGVLTMPKDSEGDTAMTDSTVALSDKRADKVYLFQFPPVLPGLSPIQVKADPDAAPNGEEEVAAAASADDDALKPAPDRQQRLPPGVVGKLRVHKSGKATMDWGGTGLIVKMGTEISFLQDIVIAALPDQKDGDNTEQSESVGMGMGQVKGKFIVTPNWDDLLG